MRISAKNGVDLVGQILILKFWRVPSGGSSFRVLAGSIGKSKVQLHPRAERWSKVAQLFTSIMDQKTTPGGKVEQGGATVGFTEGIA